MGVEGLRGYLGRSDKFKSAFRSKLSEPISSLFIDCNGIFYTALANVYKTNEDEKVRKKILKRNKDVLQKEHLDEIVRILEKVIMELKPSDNLIIAVDGQVPVAKMNQQKSRRFKSALEKSALSAFDRNALTPGTDFMIKIDQKLSSWVSENSSNLSKRVIYSSHLSPGEGEHKIFDYIRRGDLLPTTGANVIYGLDNDLIILSILSGIDNFYMKPEDRNEGRKERFISVDRMRQIIIRDFRFDGVDEKLLIQDFSVMMMLAGNDFLHKLPNSSQSFDILFPIMANVYKRTSKHLTDEENNINWRSYLRYMKNYNEYGGENNHFIKYYLHPKVHPYPEIMRNITISGKDGSKTNDVVFDKTKHNLTFDFLKFSKEWYQKQFNPEVVQWNGERVETYDNNLIKNMCISYMKTVQWVQYYYTRGHKSVSQLHSYRYLYTPLVASILTVLVRIIKSEKLWGLGMVLRDQDKLELNVIHQLFSVIPYQSLPVIPKMYQTLYSDNMSELNPSIFEVSDHNTDKEHQKLAIIPLVNVFYVDQVLRDSDIRYPDSILTKPDEIYMKEDDPVESKRSRTGYRVSKEYLI